MWWRSDFIPAACKTAQPYRDLLRQKSTVPTPTDPSPSDATLSHSPGGSCVSTSTSRGGNTERYYSVEDPNLAS